MAEDPPVPAPPDPDAPSPRIANVRPDAPDLRDRLYNPTLAGLPPARNTRPWEDPDWVARVKDQRDTEACAGYALATLVEVLQWDAWRAAARTGQAAGHAPTAISPFMLYYMACCYDGVPGVDLSAGTTARAAMKAWHSNGATHLTHWPKMFTDSADAGTEWIADAFRSPLGAYYRVDHCALPDMQAALAETPALFATAVTHAGWRQVDARTGHIPYEYGAPPEGGHAFLIVGYDAHGLWVLNSWGTGWGQSGFGRISYADWQANAMDCWIGQLGVHISREVGRLAHGLTDGAAAGVALRASDPKVSVQQINPYLINMGNNGALVTGGQLHTTPGDLRLLFTTYLDNALKDWGLGGAGTDPIPVALWAHGGLDDQNRAVAIASDWVPAFLQARIFPLFFVWRTGILDTLQDQLADALTGLPTLAGASFWSDLGQRLKDQWDDRIESLATGLGTPFWEEIKKNALADSEPAGGPPQPEGGLRQMVEAWVANVPAETRARMRVHLIGHSAGALVQGGLLPVLLDAGLTVEGVHLMAAACRVSFFEQTMLPALHGGQVRRFTQYQLDDNTEYHDTCAPLPYYRSLLYLLSNGCERQRGRPLLGMARFFNALPELQASANPGVDWHVVTAPGPESQAKHHGDFDADPLTRRTVIARVLGKSPASQAVTPLLTLPEDALFAELGARVQSAPSRPETAGAFHPALLTDAATPGAMAGGPDLAAVGKDFFNRLSRAAYEAVCGGGPGSAEVQPLLTQGENALAAAIAAVLVSQLGLLAAIAAAVAALIVKLFFNAALGTLCDQWKTALPPAPA